MIMGVGVLITVDIYTVTAANIPEQTSDKVDIYCMRFLLVRGNGFRSDMRQITARPHRSAATQGRPSWPKTLTRYIVGS